MTMLHAEGRDVQELCEPRMRFDLGSCGEPFCPGHGGPHWPSAEQKDDKQVDRRVVGGPTWGFIRSRDASGNTDQAPRKWTRDADPGNTGQRRTRGPRGVMLWDMLVARRETFWKWAMAVGPKVNGVPVPRSTL